MFREQPFGDNKRNAVKEVIKKDIGKFDHYASSVFKEEMELFGAQNGVEKDLADYVEGLWDGVSNNPFAKDKTTDMLNEMNMV